jgi:hypothetical protein
LNKFLGLFSPITSIVLLPKPTWQNKSIISSNVIAFAKKRKSAVMIVGFDFYEAFEDLPLLTSFHRTFVVIFFDKDLVQGML